MEGGAEGESGEDNDEGAVKNEWSEDIEGIGSVLRIEGLQREIHLLRLVFY